jgi:hypothetical protein
MLVAIVHRIVNATARNSFVTATPQKRSGRSIAYSKYAPTRTLTTNISVPISHLHAIAQFVEREHGGERDESQDDHAEPHVLLRGRLALETGRAQRGEELPPPQPWRRKPADVPPRQFLGGWGVVVNQVTEGEKPDNRLIDVLDHVPLRPAQGAGGNDEGLAVVRRVVGRHHVLSSTR